MNGERRRGVDERVRGRGMNEKGKKRGDKRGRKEEKEGKINYFFFFLQEKSYFEINFHILISKKYTIAHKGPIIFFVLNFILSSGLGFFFLQRI